MISLTNDEFSALTTFMKDNFGINLDKKRTLIEGRLNKYLSDKGYSGFSGYLELIFKDPSGGEVTQLLNYLTTNYSFFLREWDHFEHMRSKVLPILRETVTDHDLRIWSAGCSTGEEPYTIAMLLQDFFWLDGKQWDRKVLATDISLKALETAKNGIYDEESLSKVPPEWRKKYFMKYAEGKFQVKQSLRDEVIFRTFNLMEEKFPFQRKFHVIFCRNVMIYFDRETKVRLVQKFYNHTEPGGFLFIGQSESINREDTAWQYVMPSVFRKV